MAVTFSNSPKERLANGIHVVSFRGIEFWAKVTDWSDTRKPRVALHEYLKRDGAEGEYMGRSPHRVSFTVVFLGPTWKDDLLQLQAEIDKNPYGTLIHPFFGSMQAFCLGIDGAKVQIETALDTVTVPISFVESNVDQKLTANTSASPVAKQQLVAQYCQGLNTFTAIYVTAAAALSLLSGNALAFASSAVATISSGGTPDPTINAQLQNVTTQATTCRNLIRNDPAATSDAKTYPAIVQIEQVVDACMQLQAALLTVKPTLVQYTVPALTTLSSICQAFYGPDGIKRIDEVMANNIGKIPNPAGIRPGTVLLLAPTTLTPPKAS